MKRAYSFRLEDEVVAILDRRAEGWHTDRSEALRRILWEYGGGTGVSVVPSPLRPAPSMASAVPSSPVPELDVVGVPSEGVGKVSLPVVPVVPKRGAFESPAAYQARLAKARGKRDERRTVG